MRFPSAGALILRLQALLSALVLSTATALAQTATVERPQAEAAPPKFAVASIFSDHMVLQRDRAIPVWGRAEAGDDVTVTFDGKSQQATADADGRWRVNLESHAAGGPFEVTVAAGDETITLDDVLVGDVWVASGQSNMEWPVSAANDAEKEIAAADFPQIRIITVPHQTADEPRDAFRSRSWQAVTPKTIGRFSAVAYYFGRDLHEHLDVPIGLISCNWGGTPMEAWTSREALESSWTFMPLLKAADAPPANEQEAESRRRGPQNQPTKLFNGMLSTVIPYGIRGVIWYQGESNAPRHGQYAELTKVMIEDWRKRWEQGDFPFFTVQLAGWEPGGDGWPLLREAQFDALQVPRTGMATAIDIGDKQDIHPRNKQDVGHRLALAARAVAFDENVVHSGPVFRELTIDGKQAKVAFDHVGGGLKSKDEGGLKGFEIAGDDGKFVAAKAVIDGQTIVVSSDEVIAPTQVRYDWAAYPDGNLYNAEGMPALPFRSKR